MRALTRAVGRGCGRQEEEQEFREFAARPDAVANLFARIAPQIFGGEMIKQAVACLLFGGSRKARPTVALAGRGMHFLLHALWVQISCFGAPRMLSWRGSQVCLIAGGVPR